MGVWTKRDNRKKCQVFICSECGRSVHDIWYDENKETKCRYKFCPFCGKAMEVE